MVEDIRLENTMTGEELELSSTSTPYYILDKCLWNQIPSNMYQYKYINQIGNQVTNVTLESRQIEITGWVIASSNKSMSERKQMLNRFVSPLQPINLYYKNSFIQFIPDTTVAYGTDRSSNNEVITHFKIAGIAPDPLFRDKEETSILNAQYQKKFMFPMILARENEYGGLIFGEKTKSITLFNVHVDGDVATGMKVKFRSLVGEIKDPQITNVNNQTYIKINKTLNKDEEIIVNTNIGKKSIVGKLASEAEYSNYFQYRDIDSAWLQLEPGDNILIYSSETNTDNLEVIVSFNNTWLEVEQWD